MIAMAGKVEKGGKAEGLGASEREVRELLGRWKGMNFVRAGLVGMGALLAAVATLA